MFVCTNTVAPLNSCHKLQELPLADNAQTTVAVAYAWGA